VTAETRERYGCTSSRAWWRNSIRRMNWLSLIGAVSFIWSDKENEDQGRRTSLSIAAKLVLLKTLWQNPIETCLYLPCLSERRIHRPLVIELLRLIILFIISSCLILMRPYFFFFNK
jgi:hypothetical protein